MQYYIYIIKSKSKDRFYIGSCSNLEKRLEHHNLGHSRSTKAYTPWELVYYEKFETKTVALKREIQFKKMKSKKYIEWLINNHSEVRSD